MIDIIFPQNIGYDQNNHLNGNYNSGYGYSNQY